MWENQRVYEERRAQLVQQLHEAQSELSELRSDRVRVEARVDNVYAQALEQRARTLLMSPEQSALLRGDLLQDRVAELERERETLLAELKTRQTRVASLQLEIERYRAQNVLDLEQRRAQAEQALKAEREALRRIEERLRRLEQSIPPGETPQR
jgi:chromosome segregation ATPase